MEEALRAWLIAGQAVADLIADRTYWNVRLQGSLLPGLVLTRVGGPREYTYQGAVRLRRVRVQADCYGADNASARGLERAVTARLAPGGFTEAGVRFQGTFLQDVRDLTSQGVTDAETIHRISMDFIILYEEA